MLTILSVISAALFPAPMPIVYAYTEPPSIALEASYTPTVHVESVVEKKPLTIKEKIIAKAEEYHYSTTTAVAIATAESGLNPLAKNSSSTASGIYQFLSSTWRNNCKGDVFNEDDNINCAVRILSEGGEDNWVESSPNKKGW